MLLLRVAACFSLDDIVQSHPRGPFHQLTAISTQRPKEVIPKLTRFLPGIALAIACPFAGDASANESLPCMSTAEAQRMDSTVLSRGLRQGLH